MKITSLCPSGGWETRNIVREMGEDYFLDSGKSFRSPHQRRGARVLSVPTHCPYLGISERTSFILGLGLPDALQI